MLDHDAEVPSSSSFFFFFVCVCVIEILICSLLKKKKRKEKRNTYLLFGQRKRNRGFIANFKILELRLGCYCCIIAHTM